MRMDAVHINRQLTISRPKNGASNTTRATNTKTRRNVIDIFTVADVYPIVSWHTQQKRVRACDQKKKTQRPPTTAHSGWRMGYME